MNGFFQRSVFVALLGLSAAVPADTEHPVTENTVSERAVAKVTPLSPALFANQSVDPDLRNALIRAVNLQELDFDDHFDAQVWMLAMSTRLKPFIKDEQQRLELLKMIRQEAVIAGLKPEVVLAVIQVESRFDRYAISRVGAQGMMQVMPFWKKEIGRPDDNLIETATNLRYGCTILKHYLDREKGNLPAALARYNGSTIAGPYPGLVLSAYEERWRGGEL